MKTILTPTKPLTLRLPPFRSVWITLAGCGGTGSHIASGLASLALELAGRGISTMLYFIDPDVAEEKNVGRQLFAPADIGRRKADVLAERLNRSYGLAVASGTRRIEAADLAAVRDDECLNVVVGAVDNPAARAVILEAVKAARGRLWWLDCGNDNHSGQVLLGNTTDRRKLKPALGFVDSLPAPVMLYPDLVKTPRLKSRAPSCAEATAAGEQGLMVNRMAAAWALTMLHDLLLGQVRYFGVAFDLGQGGVRTWALDEETLKGV